MSIQLIFNVDGQNRIGISTRKGSKMVKGKLNEETTNGGNSEREDLAKKLKKIEETLKKIKNELSK